MLKKIKNIAFICEGLSYEHGGQAVSIPSLGNALSQVLMQVLLSLLLKYIEIVKESQLIQQIL